MEVRYEMAEIELLAVIAVLENVPQKALIRGQVGTMVERLALGVRIPAKPNSVSEGKPNDIPG